MTQKNETPVNCKAASKMYRYRCIVAKLKAISVHTFNITFSVEQD